MHNPGASHRAARSRTRVNFTSLQGWSALAQQANADTTSNPLPSVSWLWVVSLAMAHGSRRRFAAPHHEGPGPEEGGRPHALRPHPEERALARVSKDEAPELRNALGSLSFDDRSRFRSAGIPCGRRPNGGRARGSARTGPSSARSCRRPCRGGRFASGTAWCWPRPSSPHDR